MRKLSKTPAWMLLTAKFVLITPTLAALAWIAWPYLTFSRDRLPDYWQEDPSPSKSVFAAFRSPAAKVTGGSAGDTVSESSAVSQVTRIGGGCRATHDIKNVGAEPVQRVSLIFEIMSNSGAALGSVASSSGIIDLDPGEQRAVTFEFRCPPNIGQVTARLAKNGAEPRGIALVHEGGASRAPTDAWGVGEQFSKLVVPIKSVDICPLPNPCKLAVRVNVNAKILAEFRRDPNDQGTLVTNNQILIGKLGGNQKATIEQVQGDKLILIPLDREMLRRREQPGYVARLWDWLSGTRGSHAD